MATWEDGPEYAPLQRPADFTDAGLAPLEVAPVAVQPASLGRPDRPRFDRPATEVAPLERLVPPVDAPRDPTTPFEVVSAAMTAESSAWSAAHWSPTLHDPSQPLAPVAASAPSLPAPGYPPPGYPPPGDPAASAPVPAYPPAYPPGPAYPPAYPPGPAYPPPTSGPPTLDARAVASAATPGVLIPLVVGGLLPPLAPVLLIVSFVLSSRMTVARRRVRPAFGAAFGLLGFISVVTLLTSSGSFTEWWATLGFWAMLACWAVLAAVLVLAHRELRARAPRPE